MRLSLLLPDPPARKLHRKIPSRNMVRQTTKREVRGGGRKEEQGRGQPLLQDLHMNEYNHVIDTHMHAYLGREKEYGRMGKH